MRMLLDSSTAGSAQQIETREVVWNFIDKWISTGNRLLCKGLKSAASIPTLFPHEVISGSMSPWFSQLSDREGLLMYISSNFTKKRKEEEEEKKIKK